MQDEITAALERNLVRVRSFLKMYRREARASRGRRPVETVDLLRAAVLFLHATLEEALRAITLWRLPLATTAAHFEDVRIALSPDDRRPRVVLGDLAHLQTKTVGELIRDSVEAHLERASINNLAELKTTLVRCGIDPAVVASQAPQLAALMLRRHRIAHRADNNSSSGPGHHAARSLDMTTVEQWIGAVAAACRAVVAAT
jgi:hypothetical protein